MISLENKIMTEGRIAKGDVLRVDSFLNHKIDVRFLCEIGREFHRLFSDCGVNKILTVESSGIGVACMTAQFFDCPVLFAKKSKSSNISSEVYTAVAHSYTHGNDNTLTVSKEYLTPDDIVLIIDDFLARGEALRALVDIVSQSGARLVGCGAVIEKKYQGGGDELRGRGIRVESLAMIESMSEDGIVFAHQAR